MRAALLLAALAIALIVLLALMRHTRRQRRQYAEAQALRQSEITGARVEILAPHPRRTRSY